MVANKYGFVETIKLDFPTIKLDTIAMSDLISSISNVILQIKPDILFLPNFHDVHSDHSIVFYATYASTKNFRYPFIERILMYETLSETEFSPALSENAFIPNVFIDISEYLDKKIEIIKIFDSEVMEDNLPRSIRAIKHLGGFRGSRIGVDFAEAFMLLFEKS